MVRWRDDCERGQNPLFASSFEKTLAPGRINVSSTFGSGCTSLSTLRLSGFKSTQILMFPTFFHHASALCTFGDDVRFLAELHVYIKTVSCRNTKQLYGTLLTVRLPTCATGQGLM